MSEMTPEKATALRKPFPKESIGVLPKPYKRDSPKAKCGECGGYHGLPAAHLDFVGHAATTDRLLTVDPTWSWEPMALDQFGSPQTDRDGNLWIRLTVCGVTRIGVGDGSSMKEKIGDAIRNAAMRFGVALDLWAKENLVEFAQAATAPRPAEPPHPQEPAEPPPAARDEGLMLSTTSKLAKAMYAAINEAGIPKDEVPGLYAAVTGRDIASSKELTEAEARAVLRALDDQKPADGAA